MLAAAFAFGLARTALFALDRTARHIIDDADDRASARVRTLLQHPRQLLASLLLWHTLASSATVALLTLLLLRVGVLLGLAPVWIVVAVTASVVVTALLMLELVPRWLGTRYPLGVSRHLSAVLLPLHRLLRPAAIALSKLMKAALRRAEASLPKRVTNEDLKALVELREADGTIEAEEGDLINSLIEFGETTVREIMTSRVDVVGIPVDASLLDVAQIIQESGHSRLPLYDDHLDNILGVIYAKDILPHLTASPAPIVQVDWAQLLRPPLFTRPDRSLTELLKEFRAKRTHLAIVLDEYGGTAGLVTMEDVLEEIVGDIQDEHDQHEAAWFQQVDDFTFRVHARIHLDELDDYLDLDLDTEDYEFETLGGLIFHVTGALPQPGDVVTYENMEIEVESVANHRIEYVLIHLTTPVADDPLVEDRA